VSFEGFSGPALVVVQALAKASLDTPTKSIKTPMKERSSVDSASKPDKVYLAFVIAIRANHPQLFVRNDNAKVDRSERASGQ
jgi:hypothetical protein